MEEEDNPNITGEEVFFNPLFLLPSSPLPSPPLFSFVDLFVSSSRVKKLEEEEDSLLPPSLPPSLASRARLQTPETSSNLM